MTDPDRRTFKSGLVQDERSPYPKIYRLACILRILTTWSLSIANFRAFYSALPFYSSVIRIWDYGTGTGAGSFKCNIPQLEAGWPIVEVAFDAKVALDRSFESQVRSFITLKNLWGITAGPMGDPLKPWQTIGYRNMPPTIGITSLVLKGWLQTTVNLVSIPSSKDPEALYAFKTKGRVYRVYQEIETLLNLPPHENIHRPSYLVTKSTLYSLHNPLDPASRYISEPTEPIIGFLTPYHSAGSLRDVINTREAEKTLTREYQLKWARQLVSAVIHVFKHENGADKTRCGIYTNLKMSNIMVTSPEQGSNLVLIDFERSFGNNWSHYSPPEVDCRMPLYKGTYEQRSRKTPNSNILGRPNSIPEYIASPEDYEDEDNFWTDASNLERESAMVWSLGCCLWCIFKGKGCIEDVLNQSNLLHPELPWDRKRPTLPSGSPWKYVSRPYKIPYAVMHIVGECFNKEPERRPTLEEVSDVLEKWEKRMNFNIQLKKGAIDAKARRMGLGLEKEIEIGIKRKKKMTFAMETKGGVVVKNIMSPLNSSGIRKRRKAVVKEDL